MIIEKKILILISKQEERVAFFKVCENQASSWLFF